MIDLRDDGIEATPASAAAVEPALVGGAAAGATATTEHLGAPPASVGEPIAAGDMASDDDTASTTASDFTIAAPTVTVTPTVDRGNAQLVQHLTAELASSPAGIEFIYRSLDRVAATVDAEDAMLVVVNEDLGRQAFRAGRRPVESTWATDVVRSAPEGLHVLGAAVDDDVAAAVTNLSSVAIRLDVATHDSLHDPLTGLLNRRSFDDQLDAACSQSERYGWRFSLVLIDLDNFKSVNDRLGHQAGDAVLRAVGAELRSGLRAGDAAARVGGDEFALILPNADEALLPSLLERLRVAILQTLEDARVGLSAGMAIAPEDGTDMGSLYRMADQRLYEAKGR